MWLCHQQIWGCFGGLREFSTQTSSSSAAGLCTWYVHAPVVLGFLPNTTNSRRGRSKAVTQAPQIKRARWLKLAEVQLVWHLLLFWDWVLGPHLALLRVYSWLWAQRLLLEGFGGPYVVDPGLAICKASTLLGVLSLWSLTYSSSHSVMISWGISTWVHSSC